MEESITGGSAINSAPKGRRTAAAVIDVLFIPIMLGLLLGIVLAALPEMVRSLILLIVNIGWFLFRDLVYSPGRVVWRLKLISLTGDKITPAQALIRNLTLIVPFALVTGYFCETARVLIPKNLTGRRIAYGVLLVLGLIFIPTAIGSGQFIFIIGSLLTAAVPVAFLVLDKAGLGEGDRLMDTFSKTRVVQVG